jgi:hypothetical protein
VRVYSQRDEENIRDQSLITDWIGSGFLNAEQEPLLQAGLAVTVRRTNSVLRAVLAVFTVLIIGASVGLAMIVLEVQVPAQSMLLLAVCAGICFAIAWSLATKGRLYRCGVEEAFAAMAILLLTLSLGSSRWEYDTAFAVGAGALAAFGSYLLFGFRYAMVGAVLLAGWLPFGLKQDAVVERAISIMILALILFFARRLQVGHRGEIGGDDWAAAKVTAFGALYVVVNLMISGRGLGPNAITSGPFYWCTYVLTWIVPACGLWLGIRWRDRTMLNAGALAMLITLVTNKPYLGWMRQTWDPALLGILLIGTAIGVRRWLVRGPGCNRRGFTHERILESENRALAVTSAISVALPHPPPPQGSEPHELSPGGGQSGGGGASGSF